MMLAADAIPMSHLRHGLVFSLLQRVISRRVLKMTAREFWDSTANTHRVPGYSGILPVRTPAQTLH